MRPEGTVCAGGSDRGRGSHAAEHSEKIRTLTEEYRQKQNGEEEAEEKAEEKADEEQPERRNPENETQDREADEDEQTE